MLDGIGHRNGVDAIHRIHIKRNGVETVYTVVRAGSLLAVLNRSKIPHIIHASVNLSYRDMLQVTRQVAALKTYQHQLILHHLSTHNAVLEIPVQSLAQVTRTQTHRTQ